MFDIHIIRNMLIYCIYQKSNNEKMTSPKDTDLAIFLDDK